MLLTCLLRPCQAVFSLGEFGARLKLNSDIRVYTLGVPTGLCAQLKTVDLDKRVNRRERLRSCNLPTIRSAPPASGAKHKGG